MSRPSRPVRSAVVAGASSGVGRALAEEFARLGWRLVVSARDERDLKALAADLKVRFGAEVFCRAFDLSRADFDAEAYHAGCLEMLGAVDALLLPAGYIDDEDQGLASDAVVQKVAQINYLSAVRLLSSFAREFEARGKGTLVAFSSIAAAAPRRRNMVYASAKAGLETYVRALRHRLAGTRVRAQAYALGYVDTAMLEGRRPLLPPVSPQACARLIVARIDRDVGVKFFPCYWRFLTAGLRALPWPIYQRLDF